MLPDFEEDVCVWITRLDLIDGDLLAEGIAFDGGVGLGGEEGFERYSFSGSLVAVSGSNRETLSGRIGTMHVMNRGYLWVLEFRPTVHPPFLLTSVADLDFKFAGDVELSLSDTGRMVFERDKPDAVYPVGGQDWCGILRVFAIDAGHLTLFARPCATLEKRVTEIIFSEWDTSAGFFYPDKGKGS